MVAGYVNLISTFPNQIDIVACRYTIKTVCLLLLGVYMWYENRRRDKLAEKEGYAVPEGQRNKLAEEAGMVSNCNRFLFPYALSNHNMTVIQNDVTETDNKWFRYVL